MSSFAEVSLPSADVPRRLPAKSSGQTGKAEALDYNMRKQPQAKTLGMILRDTQALRLAPEQALNPGLHQDWDHA